uniref:Uncharacterized protein n=1 Tax=Knipowitschia caucasica TaxID=637954 RepID=A0AAV2KQ51_KNICA
MLDVVRGIETDTDKRDAPDADLMKLLDLKSKMFYAIIALSECHQDDESENCKMSRHTLDSDSELKLQVVL